MANAPPLRPSYNFYEEVRGAAAPAPAVVTATGVHVPPRFKPAATSMAMKHPAPMRPAGSSGSVASVDVALPLITNRGAISIARKRKAPPPRPPVAGSFSVQRVGVKSPVPTVKNPPPPRPPVAGSFSVQRVGVKSPVPTVKNPPPPRPPVAGSFSVQLVGVKSPVPTVKNPPPPNPPPPPAADAPVPTPAPSSRSSKYWSTEDEVAILNILRSHLRRNDDLPRGVDLVMAVFGRLERTDYSLAEIEAKIHDLRRRFEDNDALLCTGSGGPAAGHDLRLYTLSLEVWGAAATDIAAPKPVAPTPNLEPAKNAPGRKNPIPPAPRCVVAPAKRRRYEEMRERYPKLAAEAKELMRKALEGISDLTAWSLEMRAKNQLLAGATRSRNAKDPTKELTSLITNLI